ncbi:MAG TPA: hypothetical protein VFO39_13925 [Candidatus Sulfotelmatobacter sp.]|nr:hypothetical protein [Candidatus Sulfotelmatobacter sp.]
MPDFGNDGTRTVTVYNPSVNPNSAAGEYLGYTLTVAGGNPAFVYTCADRDPISRSDQFPGHPKATYTWKLQKAGEVLPLIVGSDRNGYDACSVGMSFLGAVRYDLTINLCNNDGSVKKVIQQISYTSNDSRDYYAELLGVTWA